jgi:hypothetical protein
VGATGRSAPTSAIIAPLSVQNSDRESKPVRCAWRARDEALAQLALAPTPRDDGARMPSRAECGERFRDQNVDDRVWNSRAMSPRRVSSNLCAAASRRTSVNTAVFNPLKLMSRSPLSSIGRGSDTAPSRPASASRASAGPPGYPRPRSFAVLSKASPAASSLVSPRSR